MKNTTNQVRKAPNPTGKGGFQDHPELRNPGGWKKEDSIGYQYNKLIRMTEAEFREWIIIHPDNERTVAMILAYDAVVAARNDLQYLKEVTDRTEGKAPSSPLDNEADKFPIGAPQNEKQADLMLKLMNKHHDYVNAKRKSE